MNRDDLAAMLMQTSDVEPFPLTVPKPGPPPATMPFNDPRLRQGQQPNLDTMDGQMMMDEMQRRFEIPEFRGRAPISPEEAEAARKRIQDMINRERP